MQESGAMPAVAVLAEEAGAAAFRLDEGRPLSGWAVLSGRQVWLWAMGLRPLQPDGPEDPFTYEVWVATGEGTHSLGAVGPAPGGTVLATFRLDLYPEPVQAVLITAHARNKTRPLAVVLAGRMQRPHPAAEVPGGEAQPAAGPAAAASPAPPEPADPPAPVPAPAAAGDPVPAEPHHPATAAEQVPVLAGGQDGPAGAVAEPAGAAPEPPAAEEPPIGWPIPERVEVPPFFGWPFPPPPAAVAPLAPSDPPGPMPAWAGPPAGTGRRGRRRPAGEKAAPPPAGAGNGAPGAAGDPPAAGEPEQAEPESGMTLTPGAGHSGVPEGVTGRPAGPAPDQVVKADPPVGTPAESSARPETAAEAPAPDTERPACPPGHVPLERAAIPLVATAAAPPGAQGSAHLDFVSGGVLVTIRGLPGPERLGASPHTARPFNAFRVWLQAGSSRRFLPVGVATRVWSDTWRVVVREGLPLRRYDTVVVSAEDRAGSGHLPAGPVVLAGRYRWYQPHG